MRKKIVTGLLAAVLLVSLLASTALALGDTGGDAPGPLQQGEDSDGAHRRPRDQDNVNDEVDAPRNGFGW